MPDDALKTGVALQFTGSQRPQAWLAPAGSHRRPPGTRACSGLLQPAAKTLVFIWLLFVSRFSWWESALGSRSVEGQNRDTQGTFMLRALQLHGQWDDECYTSQNSQTFLSVGS